MARLILTLLATLALPALAADAGGDGMRAFNPPPADVSTDFLRQIFGSILDGMKSGAGLDGQQTVVGAMMGVFNLAILFLTMVFVVYTTIKATVDSAHDGVLLGNKMSEIWVPIRTVGGTAFLLPLASGFSLIQMGVLWLALQGVGVADAVWSAAMGKLAINGTLGRVSVPDARPLAASVLRSEVCMAAMNKQYSESGWPERIQADVAPRMLVNTAAKRLDLYTTTEYRWHSTASSSSAAACGTLSWQQSAQDSLTRDNTQALAAPIMEAQARAVAAMIQELRPVAQQIVAWKRPAPALIDAAAARYEDAIAVAAKAAVDASPDVAQRSFIEHAETGGWILAGTWFNHMIRVNDTIQSTANMVPVSQPVRIDKLEIREVLQTYHDATAFTEEYLMDRSGAARRNYEEEIDGAAARSIRSSNEVWRLLSLPAIAGLDSLTQRIAGANTSPLTQLRVLGNDIISAGAAIKASMFVLAGFAGSRASDWTIGNVFNVTEALKTISGTVEWASSSLWALGALLAYYLPAVPVIWWIAGVIRWLASVAEAVLAAPLMAAMHVHPGGDDLVGRAGPGYMLILAMIIQPALLLFGLILAALMTYPAGALVNMMFLSVVSGIAGTSFVGIVGFISFTALYVVMMIVAVQGCFALISAVPDNVMRFVGSQAGAQGVGMVQGEKGVGSLEGGAKGAGSGAAKGHSGDQRSASKMGGGDGGVTENAFSNADHLSAPKD